MNVTQTAAVTAVLRFTSLNQSTAEISVRPNAAATLTSPTVIAPEELNPTWAWVCLIRKCQ